MEIGLFPLELVLLPTERVPLHIFEPRYRDLIGECLARDREFGLVLSDERGLREIGTRAAVTEVIDRFPDGRLNILVEGGDRFRLLELTKGRTFQTAEIEPVADEDTAAPEEDVERARGLFRDLREPSGCGSCASCWSTRRRRSRPSAASASARPETAGSHSTEPLAGGRYLWKPVPGTLLLSKESAGVGPRGLASQDGLPAVGAAVGEVLEK